MVFNQSHATSSDARVLDIKGKSDDEVFEQVLEMMTDYGGTGEVVENISLTEKEFDTYDELDPELGE